MSWESHPGNDRSYEEELLGEQTLPRLKDTFGAWIADLGPEWECVEFSPEFLAELKKVVPDLSDETALIAYMLDVDRKDIEAIRGDSQTAEDQPI